MTAPPLDILLIDDSAPEGQVLQMLAEGAGLPNRVVHVASGGAALEYLNDDQEDLPGLALLDINMPGMGGLETLAAIRASASPQIASLRVVVLSTSGTASDREAAGRLNALDYVVKASTMTEYREFVVRLPEYLS
jgi:CheY-like chemotaxis protein